ncbi:hypothetical protein V6N13_039157 [Hibiscus sabdariffa]|uniref:Uncharacterized protein n=1 Tax=Hibiscus sabdariffa TaxID=183260 RepID=A0ABR2SWP0_9ROSI
MPTWHVRQSNKEPTSLVGEILTGRPNTSQLAFIPPLYAPIHLSSSSSTRHKKSKEKMKREIMERAKGQNGRWTEQPSRLSASTRADCDITFVVFTAGERPQF